MLNNPILYRVLTRPFLYQWVLAVTFPLLLWAVLVKLSRSPGILHVVFPWLKALALVGWSLLIVWPLYCLFAPGSGIFFPVQTLIFAVFSGTSLMYHWAGRRVDPQAYIKKPNDGWWPSKPEV